jgi:shikimate kinase
MRIFITGVACVGKTTIGENLAALLGYQFFDLDAEIERFFGAPIPRLRERFLTQYSYHVEAAKALKHVLSRKDSQDCVIALPPGGLGDAYWRVVKTLKAPIVVLQDTPENILKRITFYDDDSHLIEKTLTDREKRYYLRDIKADMSYFRRTYRRANLTVDIAGLGPEAAAQKTKDVLTESLLLLPGGQPEKQCGADRAEAPAPHAE